ncbi:tyrosine-type recombinase/integrase [Klebsiella sp. C239]|uniref:site-specific integrase n=1 Tax=Klebsiella TaxID=570 RepID=UPI000A6E2F4C|nr:site-specific integrase [Klebsiella quasipneumoniae]HBR2081211.1 site-specific integrase [Klebsiella quasipneumoniae subsp. quasipneumoniae]EIY5096943.1 site-specific integrase [Klebsiella quasipneumoniae]MCA4033875.1 tyrosine-type recombinase/integrase [Klebsiella quasipneumoniae]MCQ3861674.1 tyrosine-type recombinase/integrase [Klebsiella quasipneumoniae]SXD08024.1 phage integrase family site-specific recombinase [Klebsiella quasipneumoniae]
MDHKRVKPKDKRDRYLILDPCGVYMVRITVPAYMSAYFGGKMYFMKSTGTRDIRQARLFRDAVALEWYKLRNQLKPVRSGSRVEQILDELRGISKQAKDTPPAQLNSPAQVQACPSLLVMRDQYILQFSEKRKLTTLSKTNKAVEVLLAHLKKRDVQLRDINRTTVTGWLDKLKSEKAPQTIQNYISALAQIWDLARNRYHDAPQDNPWRGHGLEAKSSKVSYEVFTHAELAKVFAALDGDTEMQAVTRIGMYSGMRLNEICSLRVENIRRIEGILCFEVTEGKTKSAARIIPVHNLIIDLVEALLQKPHNGFLFYRASITDRADGKRSTWHVNRFTRAKRKALGVVESERKVFHSLRHEVAQQLDRGGVDGKNPVPEDRIALLLGHERGKTETFKTYSKNAASPVELSRYVELINYDIVG